MGGKRLEGVWSDFYFKDRHTAGWRERNQDILGAAFGGKPTALPIS